MLPARRETNFEPTDGRPALRRLALALALVTFVCLHVPTTAGAQDWSEPDDDWGVAREPTPSPSGSSGWNEPAGSAWAFRVGAGFTVDPNTFLLNFELPYSFDRFVSAGPMLQVGIEDEKLIVAPTLNLTIRVPDMPGDDFDRFHPHIFGGVGLGILNNDDRRGENTDVGFLVNTGFGVDFDLSERVTLGSRMIFNFLPADRTLGQKFWYSWEVGSIRLAF